VISSNSAEVSANYTVYDYEDLNPNFKSYSFRQLAFRDSTIIKFSRKLKSEIHAYLNISEQGDFKWNNFSNQPVRYLQEIYAEPKFFYSIGQLELGLGIRLFELSTYNYNDKNEKELSSRYTSIGPLTDIRLLMNDSLRLKVYGYYEFISTESSNKSEQANLNIQVDWLL
jgi:nucleoside-specific outer membrane channel protein Tsx